MVILGTPIIKNTNFRKLEFILYTYGVEKSIVVVVTKKEGNNEECLITFFSKTLHNHEEIYSFIEKQVYIVMKVLNNLKYFISQRKVLLLIIHSNMRNYIIQGELREGRA